jgi:hypothetical protein
MRKKYLALLPAIALLALVKQACAIGITVDSNSHVFARVAPAENGGSADDSVPITGPSNVQAAVFSAVAGSRSARGDFSFTNDATTATFLGNTDIVNNSVGSSRNTSSVESQLNFTLTETVNYSIAGTSDLFLRDGAGALTFAQLMDTATFELLYRDLENVITPGSSVNTFDNSGIYAVGSMTGSLGPGSYRFLFLDQITDGEGGTRTGFVSLTLTRPDENGDGNSVPDAGSSVMLLGMALTAIGCLRSKFNI